MKKLAKALPLLFVFPLLMAGAMPMPATERYSDLDVKVKYLGEDKERYYETHGYELEVTNTGEEYSYFYTIHGYEKSGNVDKNHVYFLVDEINPVFYQQALAPGQTETYVSYLSEKAEITDSFIYEAECYTTRLDDVLFENPEIVKYYKEEKTYVFKANIKNGSDTNYALFVDLMYRGKQYTLYMYYNRQNHTFRTYEDLDLSQLEIKGVHVYQEVAALSNNNLLTFDAITVVIILVVLALLLGAILIPVVVVFYKKKKENAQ